MQTLQSDGHDDEKVDTGRTWTSETRRLRWCGTRDDAGSSVTVRDMVVDEMVVDGEMGDFKRQGSEGKSDERKRTAGAAHGTASWYLQSRRAKFIPFGNFSWSPSCR